MSNHRNGVAVLTLISNKFGVGPGHSAIVVGDTVWTFEELQGPMGQSWLIIDTKQYLGKNKHRPVVVQELNEKVSAPAVLRYIQKSIMRDDDYGTSGVCSSQVASAIESGCVGKFDPIGIDTPRSVYVLMKRRGHVRSLYYYWPEAGQLNDFVRHFLLTSLEKDYADVNLALPKEGVATW